MSAIRQYEHFSALGISTLDATFEYARHTPKAYALRTMNCSGRHRRASAIYMRGRRPASSLPPHLKTTIYPSAATLLEIHVVLSERWQTRSQIPTLGRSLLT